MIVVSLSRPVAFVVVCLQMPDSRFSGRVDNGNDTYLVAHDVEDDPLLEPFEIELSVFMPDPAVVGDAKPVGMSFDLKECLFECVEELAAELRRLILVPAGDPSDLVQDEFGTLSLTGSKSPIGVAGGRPSTLQAESFLPCHSRCLPPAAPSSARQAALTSSGSSGGLADSNSSIAMSFRTSGGSRRARWMMS